MGTNLQSLDGSAVKRNLKVLDISKITNNCPFEIQLK
jgi:hypothetical protein